jgi:hypothetical protein
MQDLSLHILDIAENGVSAGASLIRIEIDEDLANDLLIDGDRRQRSRDEP